MDDATLVEAARSGDGSAWAAIYDRYADKLHDHCHRILRDRDEAADALHDAFIAAAAHLDQLRDPARLRPWLYSICRHESLRRARQRSRVELTDEVDEMKSVDVDMDRGSRSEELQELVWSAAAGLNPRDQAMLDLNLRQGLEGQDLADAMGTSLDNSYVMLSRLRDQVERSLGALLIARLGRDDCEELAALLVGWDGTFSPLLRKRVARHVDGCEVCRERRAAVVSPMALLAAAPLVPAPTMLRRRILDGIEAGAAPQPISFTKDGFAAAPRRPVAPRPVWWLVAAMVVVAGVVGTLLAIGGGDDPTPLAANGPTSTAVEPAAPTTEAPTTTTTTAPAPTTTTTTEAPAGPPSTEEPVVLPPPDTAPPVISGVPAAYPAFYATYPSCTAAPKQRTISATISGATSAQLYWSGPVPNGSTVMSASGDTWSAVLGPFEQSFGGVINLTVEAVDAAGNRTVRTATVDLNPCPG
ncbi:MAG: sigma-70 family RNA polymerase sigma factor [Acidimicrobiales bacterium]